MQHLSEKVAVIGTIDPIALNNEKFTDVIDMSKYTQVMCIFLWATIAGDMTCRAVTCDSAGNNVGALKTATKTSSNPDNSQIIVEVDNNDLAGGGSNADRYIKFGMVSDNGADVGQAVVLGVAKYGPSSDGDLATVVEIETDLD